MTQPVTLSKTGWQSTDEGRPNPEHPFWEAVSAHGVPYGPDIEESAAPMVPPGTAMADYVMWRHMRSDAPSIYAVGAWLTLLATAFPGKMKVELPGGMMRHPGLFMMLVGNSGESRKSSAIDSIVDMLIDVERPKNPNAVWVVNTTLGAASGSRRPPRLTKSPGSSAGIMKILKAHCPPTGGEGAVDVTSENHTDGVATVVTGDFGHFAQSTGQGQYLQGLKQLLLQLASGERVSEALKKEDVELYNYSLTWLAGINRAQLEEFSSPADLQNGYLSRWMFLNGERTRHIPLGQPQLRRAKVIEIDQKIRYAMIQRLNMYVDQELTVQVHPDASKMMEEWDKTYVQNIPPKFRHLAAIFSRAASLLIRISALYAFERFCSLFDKDEKGHGNQYPPLWAAWSRDNGWGTITGHIQQHVMILPEDVTYASYVVDYHLTSAIDMFPGLAGQTRNSQLKKRVLDAIPPSAPGASIGKITKAVGETRRVVSEIMTTLLGEGEIVQLPAVAGSTDTYIRQVAVVYSATGQVKSRPPGAPEPVYTPPPSATVVPPTPAAGVNPTDFLDTPPVYSSSAYEPEVVELSEEEWQALELENSGWSD